MTVGEPNIIITKYLAYLALKKFSGIIRFVKLCKQTADIAFRFYSHKIALCDC